VHLNKKSQELSTGFGMAAHLGESGMMLLGTHQHVTQGRKLPATQLLPTPLHPSYIPILVL
jgi:hypothetical protein